jgi:hypothetical protein
MASSTRTSWRRHMVTVVASKWRSRKLRNKGWGRGACIQSSRHAWLVSFLKDSNGLSRVSTHMKSAVTTNLGTSLGMDCKCMSHSPPSPPKRCVKPLLPLLTWEGGDGQLEATHWGGWWMMDVWEISSLLQEDHLNWSSNQIIVKPLLTL